MATNYGLSNGALEIIMSGGNVQNPIVQVLGSKKIGSGVKDTERYRLLLSDGRYKVNVGIYSCSQVIKNGLDQYSIIKLKRYVSNVIKTKDNRDTRILLILDLDIIAEGITINGTIGNPANLTESESSASSNTLVSQDLPTLEGSPVTNASKTKKKQRLKQLSDARFICPIASLNPFHNDWIIKGRVITKTNTRNWSNARGEGKFFSVSLADQSGEIKCTAFRELVDQFFELFEVDKVYYVSNCICKPANQQFSDLNHEFEMVLTQGSVIEESLSDNEEVPVSRYDFVLIEKIAVMEPGTLVDILGICQKVSEIQTFVAKSTNREMKKREVSLVDQSRLGISLILWGNDAETIPIEVNSVLAVKNAKVQEFKETKNVSLVGKSQLRVSPNLPECKALQTWLASAGDLSAVKNISHRRGLGGQVPFMTFQEVYAEDMTKKKAGFYFQTYGTILVIKLDRAVYKACPLPDCQKKLIDLENGMYRCEKCNREYNTFQHRLLVSMNISDATTNQWVTVFSAEAEKILRKTAREISDALDKDPDCINKICEDAQFRQFVFRCRAKIDYFTDEPKLKVVVVGVSPINFEEHNAFLLERIQKFRETQED